MLLKPTLATWELLRPFSLLLLPWGVKVAAPGRKESRIWAFRWNGTLHSAGSLAGAPWALEACESQPHHHAGADVERPASWRSPWASQGSTLSLLWQPGLAGRHFRVWCPELSLFTCLAIQLPPLTCMSLVIFLVSLLWIFRNWAKYHQQSANQRERLHCTPPHTHTSCHTKALTVYMSTDVLNASHKRDSSPKHCVPQSTTEELMIFKMEALQLATGRVAICGHACL